MLSCGGSQKGKKIEPLFGAKEKMVTRENGKEKSVCFHGRLHAISLNSAPCHQRKNISRPRTSSLAAAASNQNPNEISNEESFGKKYKQYRICIRIISISSCRPKKMLLLNIMQLRMNTFCSLNVSNWSCFAVADPKKKQTNKGSLVWSVNH